METTSENGTNAINATSKPRGTYLDPLKACALSGESGVNIGKSESATYSKYMNIVRQTRRTASRVSVLNDVERSRLSSVMRRIDGERAYSTAVMDRQKRQFKQSLENLDRHRCGLLRQIDEVVTAPAHLRAKQNLLMSRRQHRLQVGKSTRDSKQHETADQRNPAHESLPQVEPKESNVTQDKNTTELPALASHARSPYLLRAGVEKPPPLPNRDDVEQKGENVPVFYTGLGSEKLEEQIRIVHSSRQDAKRADPE